MTTQTVNLKFVLSRGDTITGMKAIAAESSATQQKIKQSQLQADKEMLHSNERLNASIITATTRTAQAREVLGIRSEHAIQREIQRTEAAYNRLARSGTASARDLAAAEEAKVKKLRELNNELRTGTTLYSKFQTVVAAGAAIAAGGYVVKRAADKAMSFDERLALMSNTAFAERDVAGRRRGMRELETVINESVRSGTGGGTREQAAEALDAMIARNTLGRARSIATLPTVMKTAAGSGAQPLDIANLSSVLYGQGTVKNDNEYKIAMNMITAAGQEGGFEIRDMAKWLSQQLPMGGKSGLTGLSGLQKILTMNQAAIMTAGSTDEAGNNVKNLLAKLNSPDTAKDFDKAGRGDLAKFLIDQRLKGVDSVDAWMSIIDKEAASNPQMKGILAKLEKSKDKGEQQQLLTSLSAIAEGTVVGRYFQDMQATGALLGMRNKDLVSKVDAGISKNRKPTGVNDVNYALMSSTASAQVRAAEQAKDAGVKEAMDGLTPAIGKVATNFENLATKHPLLTGATVTATTAITAMAGAAGLASMALSKNAGGEVAGSIVAGSKKGLFAAGVGALAGGIASIPGLSVGTLLQQMPIISAMPGINQTLFNGPAGGWGNAVNNLYNQNSQPQEAAKIETTVRVELAEGLRAVHQTTQKDGPIDLWTKTGSVWGHP